MMSIKDNQKPDPSSHLVIGISGTPYAGKSKLLSRFIRESNHGRYELHRRVTTRPVRPIEDDAPTYEFLTEDQFQKEKEKQKFLIVERNFGYYWGTRQLEVMAALEKNQVSIIVTNVNVGFKVIRHQWPSALLIFISPVDIDNNFSIDRGKLRQVLDGRIEADNRKCLCPMKKLLDYCTREVARLADFKDVHIIHNPNGVEGLQSAYDSFEVVAQQFGFLKNKYK